MVMLTYEITVITFQNIEDLRIKIVIIKVKLNYKILIVFCILQNYDSYITMEELGKLDFKINVLSNGLEKYINFNINNKFIFVDSFKFFKFLSR